MRVFHDTPSGVNEGDSVVLRVLRGGCLPLLASPFAVPVAVTCVWLLAYLISGVYRAPAEVRDWGLADAAGCAACTVGLALMACLAVGHIVLMCIAGLRSGRS